jgi:hypothetical protein
LKTAAETILVGKEGAYNRRFPQLCGHYLVEPVACTPASGWEKGQVENQVGLVRERFFSPRLRVKNYEELNAWLLDKCIAARAATNILLWHEQLCIVPEDMPPLSLRRLLRGLAVQGDIENAPPLGPLKAHI